MDREGYTPLHLAVRSVDALESCRPVRSLLIKGAKIDIKDAKGRMPFDYVKEVKSRQFARELYSLLARNQSSCHLVAGTTPVQKVTRSYQTILAYYFLYSLVVFFKVTVIFPKQELEPTLLAIFVDIVTIMLHLMLSLFEPGYLKNDNIDFIRLLETFDSSSLCPECETIRTAGSRHCIICHRCVDRYDHHCPWINNCVGIRNHNVFLGYLFFQITTLALSIA